MPAATSLAAVLLTVVALCSAGPAAAVPTVPVEYSWVHPAPTVRHGPTDRPRIALTFDDNYERPQAFETLRVLKENRVPATVFVIGHYAELGPNLAKELERDGFEIGDHTRSHANSPTLSWRALQIEIGNGTRTFHKLTGGDTAPLFRPPGGFTNEYVATAAAAQGFRYVVLWDVDPQDWRGASAAAIRDTVLGNAHNGAIVLLHVAAPHTAEALPSIIRGLRNKGYELVTLTELLKSDRRFADVDPADAEGKNILRMVDAGYLTGLDADYFGPYDRVTRTQLARAAVLATAAATGTSPSPTARPDYEADAVPAGLLDLPEASAAADSPLDRLTLARVLGRMARAKGYDPQDEAASGGPTAAPIDVPHADRDDVGLVTRLGLMTAQSPERFGAEVVVQRRQVATVLARYAALPTVGPSTLRAGAGGVGAATSLSSEPDGAGRRWASRLSIPRPALTAAALALAVAIVLVGLRRRAVRSRRSAASGHRPTPAGSGRRKD